MQMRPSRRRWAPFCKICRLQGSDADAWYANSARVNKALLVVVTSDCGSARCFQLNCYQAALRVAQENFANKQATILPIGKKVYEFFTKRNQKLVGDYCGTFSGLELWQCWRVLRVHHERVPQRWVWPCGNSVTTFKNAATQIPTVEQYLPRKTTRRV